MAKAPKPAKAPKATPARKKAVSEEKVTPLHLRNMRIELAAAEEEHTKDIEGPGGRRKGDGPGEKAKEAADGKLPSVPWARDHALTDTLLTMVEDNEPRRMQMGFGKGDGPAAGKATSDNMSNHCYDVGVILLQKHESGKWDTASKKYLTNVIRNRVNTLKRDYKTYHEKLGTTGQGLVRDEETEKDITPGTTIANLWDKIKLKFPWYRRMDALMGESPIVDTSAIVNSASDLSLDFLDRSSSPGPSLAADMAEDMEIVPPSLSALLAPIVLTCADSLQHFAFSDLRIPPILLSTCNSPPASQFRPSSSDKDSRSRSNLQTVDSLWNLRTLGEQRRRHGHRPLPSSVLPHLLSGPSATEQALTVTGLPSAGLCRFHVSQTPPSPDKDGIVPSFLRIPFPRFSAPVANTISGMVLTSEGPRSNQSCGCARALGA